MPKVPGTALPFPGAKVDDNVLAIATADYIGGIRRGSQTKVPVYKDPVHEDDSFLSKEEKAKLDIVGLEDLSALTQAPIENRKIYGDNE